MRRRITALRSSPVRSSSYREPAAVPVKVSLISRVVQTVWKSDFFGFGVRMLSLIRPLVNDIELVLTGISIEGRWKEGKQATNWTRLSCHHFRANEVRLQLSVLAYNLGNLWRRLGLPHRIKSWSLTSLQHRLVKTGGRLIRHARYHWLLLAEGHLNRRLFGSILQRIWALPVPDG